MDTITFEHQGQTFEVPLVVAFGPNGKPVDLAGDRAPEDCDHHDAIWSSCFDMRCPRCGSRLFLPSRFLAHLAEDDNERMYDLWCAAGWPSATGGKWHVGDDWTLIEHALFAALGGLPVRNDRAEYFASVAQLTQATV